jgi:hypothetical protein
MKIMQRLGESAVGVPHLGVDGHRPRMTNQFQALCGHEEALDGIGF